jgi:hypothetical protein
LLQPYRTYCHFYKKGFLNSQAVRIRVKKHNEKEFYEILIRMKSFKMLLVLWIDSARWYLTHTCSTLLKFNCENGVIIQNFYFKWGQYSTYVALPPFPSVITTIMDQKLLLLKPLNKRELYTTQQNLWIHTLGEK